MAEGSSPSTEAAATPEPPLGYEVVRGPNRRGPHFITCLSTDADPSRWRKTGGIVDSTGATCYWVTGDKMTSDLTERWKKGVGRSVAKLLGLSEDQGDEDWRLTDLPKNYKLYRYLKGNREDVYLLGSAYVFKFRTANEFSPHVHWLCTNKPLRVNRCVCKCKYCSGEKSQSAVNSSLGLHDAAPKKTGSPILDHKSSNGNKRKVDEMSKHISQGPMSSGLKAKLHVRPPQPKKLLPNGICFADEIATRRQTFSGPYANKDRDRDLCELKCAFRLGELVWCKLDRSICDTKEEDPSLRIDYWPGVCEERVLNTIPEVLTRPTVISPNRHSNHDSEWIENPPILKVEQIYDWKVQLLGTSDVLRREESQLLAYLNYPIPLNLYKLPIHPKTLSNIHNHSQTKQPTIESFLTLPEAITTFAFAVQMSVHIKKSWTLMDRYDIPFLKKTNACTDEISAQDSQILYDDSAFRWYQYLWWGAEKIWSGELIRLIISASDYPKELKMPSAGNLQRCVFLKITGIYRNEQEVAMIKGPIYEIISIQQQIVDEANPDKPSEESFDSASQVCRHMPAPPPGFVFKRLTPIGKEYHLKLQYIAGRYYPPSCLSLLPQPVQVEDDVDHDSLEGRSLSLCGLAEGKWLHMHCDTWTPDRKECFVMAETWAEQEIITSS